jgi:hypothetical protein
VNFQIVGGGGCEAGSGGNQIGDRLGLDLLLVLTESGSIRPATLLVLARARRAFTEVAAPAGARRASTLQARPL